jgi:hypothetical protein
LVRYFPFDTDFNDYSSGNANSSNALVLQGNTAVPTTPYFTLSNKVSAVRSSSLQLNFLNDSPDLHLANLHSPISNYNQNGYTISFWLYKATNDSTTLFNYQYGSLITLTSGQNLTGGGNYVYDIRESANSLLFNYGNGSYMPITYGRLNSGWTHIAFTITSSGILNRYINGGLIGDSTFGRTNIQFYYYPQVTGISIYSGGFGNGNANIDDLYYFDGVLTDMDILNLYNSSVKSTTTTLTRYYPFFNNLNDYATGSSNTNLVMINPTGGTTNNYIVTKAGYFYSPFSCQPYVNTNGWQCAAINNTSYTYNYGNPPTHLNSYPLTICSQNNNGYTFSFWTPVGGSTTIGGTIFQVNSNNNYPNFNMLYSVEQIANSSNLSINYASNNNSVSSTQVNLNNPSGIKWSFIVITISTSNIMNVYVNSVLASTTTMQYSSNISGIQFYTGFNTYSNSRPSTNGLVHFYYVDGILNNNQIRLLYNRVAGVIGSGSSLTGYYTTTNNSRI